MLLVPATWSSGGGNDSMEETRVDEELARIRKELDELASLLRDSERPSPESRARYRELCERESELLEQVLHEG